jgi:hypothetical protein
LATTSVSIRKRAWRKSGRPGLHDGRISDRRRRSDDVGEDVHGIRREKRGPRASIRVVPDAKRGTEVGIRRVGTPDARATVGVPGSHSIR